MDVMERICDPRELGTVDYKVITNRCRFRMLNLRNSHSCVERKFVFSREMALLILGVSFSFFKYLSLQCGLNRYFA